MGGEKEEVTFYSDDRGVRITNTRLTVDNTTYAMANITSVSIEQEDRSYTRPGLLSLIGLVVLFIGLGTSSGAAAVFGLLALVGGVWWAYSLEPDYYVRISSAAGESSTLFTREKAYVEKVVHAIHEAIIHRG
ncbi:MAG TPA: DUF6232 family protein [Terriglobia bacterium]|nr:DUF6232 family protein [Terriglobia bacterium]